MGNFLEAVHSGIHVPMFSNAGWARAKGNCVLWASNKSGERSAIRCNKGQELPGSLRFGAPGVESSWWSTEKVVAQLQRCSTFAFSRRISNPSAPRRHSTETTMPLVIYPLKRTNVAVLNDVTYAPPPPPSIQSECETKLTIFIG